jgi:sulfite reductase (ferredoxin)
MSAKPIKPAGLPVGKPAVPPAGNGKPALPPTAKPALPPAKKPALPPLPGGAAAGKPALPGGVAAGKPTLPVKDKLSGNEKIKEESRGLRGHLAEDLAADTDHFDREESKQLLKFHGIYQQDDRDNRKGGKEYIFMIRSRLPGGKLTSDQYLIHEALADQYGNGTLRITTRQGFQLHGVIKGNLKKTMRTLNEKLVTTLAACGDVVRNVICSSVPVKSNIQRQIDETAKLLGDYFLPRSGAYHEVWVDGEQVYNGLEHVEVVEPIYGKAYMPRKFKIGIVAPGDNSIDVYSNDVGLIAIAEGDNLVGYNVVVGGGLGMTHGKANTFPRLADTLAFVTVDQMLPVVENIIKIQRDFGNRADRKHARLKYLVADWGIQKFRDELEKRLGYRVQPPVPTPPLELNLYLGWNEQGDGNWYVGISIENGRIQDTESLRLKSALHEVVTRFKPGIRLTANHDLIFTDIRPEDRPEIEAILKQYGVRDASELSNARKYAMACPAMPTCGLAISESERIFPSVIDEFEEEFERLGLDDEKLTIRMTGCPNGCARPYVADIGFVGRSLDRYTVFLGGRMDGTRLNQEYKDLVPLNELVSTLRPLLIHFKHTRQADESFGDFCNRLGIETLHEVAASYQEQHAVLN